MYDSKAEAEKNYLYTSRVIAIFFLLFALAFIAMTKKNATTYLAIKLSPIEATAQYERSVEINRYKIDTYFSYEDLKGNLHSYYEFDKEVRTERQLKILYSKFFPHIAYPANEIDDLNIDAYIFIAGILFVVFFLLVVAYYGIRIYLLRH